MLIPGAAVNILAGLAVVRIVRRFRFGTVMATGLFCSGLAYLLLALTSGHTTILAICLMYMLIGLGIGSAETLSNDLMMANIPREKAGSAAAVSETSYELGTVLGVTILGGLLSATYRAALEVPDTLSAGQAAAAEQTLAGAVETGHGLSGPSGEALVSAAAAAFGTGTYLTALVCAIAMIVISTGTYVALRRERG